jgi:hypothetical protein
VTTLDFIRSAVIPAAMKLLPPRLDSFEARVLLVAIGLQESRFTHRKQIGGPARGFWQFESAGGVQGVLTHHATKPLITPVLHALRYSPGECYYAIEHNDTLAAVFARLLLFSDPKGLPEDAADAWEMYLDTWRPGEPHRETWDAFYAQAWALEAA